MAARRIIRRLVDLLDVQQTGWVAGDVPVYDGPGSSFAPGTVAAGGGGVDLAADGTTYTSGTVLLSGGPNITVGTAGQTITISADVTAGAADIAAAGHTYTSGTVVLSGGGAVSVGTNGQTITITAPAQTAQTQNVIDLTLSGNTAGALALASSGTVTLAGGNNITLSQAGNAITISGPTTVAQSAQTGISSIQASDATYTSGKVIFTGAGDVTVASGTGQRVIISAPVQTAETAISGISASDTVFTSGTVKFTGVGGGVTVSSNTGQRVDISVAAPVAQTVQTQNVVDLTLSGNTAGVLALVSSGTLTLAGGNNITVSQAGNAVTISGPNVGGAQTGISSIAASDTTYTSGQVEFTGSNMVTVKSSANQRVVIDATQTVQTQDVLSVGASTGGNTSGNTTVNTGSRLVFVGSNNITLSQGTAAGATTLTISGPATSAQQTGISGVANSQTTYTSGTVTLSELGAITIRSTTGNQYQFSVAAQTAESNTFGISNLGNTSGTSGTIASNQARLLLAGGNNITLSQSTNGGSATITISAPNAATGISGVANSQTTYTSGTVSLSDLANITIRSTTGNQYQFSVANPQTAISGVANSQTTYTSGTVSLSELGAITIRSTTGNQFQFSVNSQTNQSAVKALGVSNTGNTAGNTGVSTGIDWVVAGSNNITASESTTAGGPNTIWISGPTLPAGIALSNSQTTYTSGTVGLSELGAITIRSTTGNQFQFSVNSQTVQTQNMVALSATNTLYTSGTVTITGSNMVTVKSSAAGQAIVIDATQTVQTQDVLSIGVSTGGNTSGNTTVNTGSRLVFVGSNNITLSQGTAAGATTLTISGPSFAETQTGISGIANSQTTYTSGTVSMSELGAITIRSTTGNQYQFSVNSQTVQTQNFVALSATNTLYTSGTVLLTGSNMITVKSSGAGQTVILDATQSVQTQDVLSVGVSTGGNTSGNTTVNTGSRLVFVGSNNITVSQGTAAGATTLTISGPSVAETQTAISGIANSQTTYTSGTVSMSELGAITIRSTTGNQYQFSVNSQTAESNTFGISNLGNTAGTSGTIASNQARLLLAGGNNITVSQSTNGGSATITISGANAATGISGFANSQTTYTSGTVTLSELGAITIRSTTGNQYQFSVNAQTTQSAIKALGVSNTGNTAGNTGVSTGIDWVLAASNNLTASQSTAGGGPDTIWLSGPALLSAGMSTGGNTSGDTGFASNRLAFAGGNNITLSGSTNAGSMTITISAPNLGAGAMSAGASNLGNTAGSTGVTGTRLVLVGSNAISLSQSTDASGGTITINDTVSAFQAGMSTDGNTAGNTGVTGTRFVFVGTGPISLSQTTGANGGTLSINAPATSSLSASTNIVISTNGSTILFSVPKGTVSMWPDPVDISSLQYAATQGIGASGATQTTVTAWVWPVVASIPVAFNNIELGINNSFTTATTSISSVSFRYFQGASLGLYTLTGSTMSLSTSWSQSFEYSNGTAANATNGSVKATLGWGGSNLTQSTQGFANISNMTESWLGSKRAPLNWSTVSQTLTEGQYFAVLCYSALTSGNNQAALSQVGFRTSALTFPPVMGKSTASVTSPFPFNGLATLVNSSNSLMPVSFNTSKITTATAVANSTNFQVPWFRFYSSHSN